MRHHCAHVIDQCKDLQSFEACFSIHQLICAQNTENLREILRIVIKNRGNSLVRGYSSRVTGSSWSSRPLNQGWFLRFSQHPSSMPVTAAGHSHFVTVEEVE